MPVRRVNAVAGRDREGRRERPVRRLLRTGERARSARVNGLGRFATASLSVASAASLAHPSGKKIAGVVKGSDIVPTNDVLISPESPFFA